MRGLVSESEYSSLCDEFDELAGWGQLELVAYALLFVLPPLAVHYQRWRRHRRWQTDRHRLNDACVCGQTLPFQITPFTELFTYTHGCVSR